VHSIVHLFPNSLAWNKVKVHVHFYVGSASWQLAILASTVSWYVHMHTEQKIKNL